MKSDTICLFPRSAYFYTSQRRRKIEPQLPKGKLILEKENLEIDFNITNRNKKICE